MSRVQKPPELQHVAENTVANDDLFDGADRLQISSEAVPQRCASWASNLAMIATVVTRRREIRPWEPARKVWMGLVDLTGIEPVTS